jgi:hypothetical protein
MRNIEELKRSELDCEIELKNKILNFVSTNRLGLDWVSNYKQIIYHYTNGLIEIPFCYCGEKNKFKSYQMGYRKTCSPKCSNSSKEKIDKIAEIKCERYGSSTYNNSVKMMDTKTDRYGSSTYNNREKAVMTNKEKYGSYSPMKNSVVKNKVLKTKEERYGSSSYNNIEKIKKFWMEVGDDYVKDVVEKIRKTKEKNYGDGTYNNPTKMFDTKMDRYGHYFVNYEKAYLTKVDRGHIKTGLVLEDWNLYKREVARFTRRCKKDLYESWNGYDYYDGEFIKGYLSNSHIHKFYPTMDHKISVYYGFINSIDPNFIGSIENLCITKRFINSIKSKMTEEEFLKS